MLRPLRYFAILALTALCAGCRAEVPADPPAGGEVAGFSLPEGSEAISFLGETLYAPVIDSAARVVYAARYAEAEAALAMAPDDVDALIWMGRRTAYLGQYRAAIDIYSHALTLHPDDARLYRHRGHRYLSVRELDNAIADFQRAVELTAGQPDEVEPDGLPNALGIPTSTLQFNIWYHLGLAHYLKGDFDAAADAYLRCAEVSDHDDSKVATAYWRYMTLARLGRTDDAREVAESLSEDMDLIESEGYLDLVLLFRGERTESEILGPAGPEATLGSTTAGYGVGFWHMSNGREREAIEVFERTLLGRESQWSAFGFIAAEAELARLRPVG
jgi:tetratricopeptide (TPR) repeat protein